jgi:hypothetical protein
MLEVANGVFFVGNMLQSCSNNTGMDFVSSRLKRLRGKSRRWGRVGVEVEVDLVRKFFPFGIIHGFVIENSSTCMCFVSALAM